MTAGGSGGPVPPGGSSPHGAGPSTYASAGVDIDAADEAVARLGALVASATRPEVIGGIGGFGGLFAFPQGKYERPVLVSSTDGVGTKSYVASALGTFSTIGIDLVAMCVDDLVCAGAEPLFLVDYLAVEHLDPDMAAEVVGGVAEGCRQAGCALVGGEMAEHPPEPSQARPPTSAPSSSPASLPGQDQGTSSRSHFDLAGFAVGVVDEAAMVRPEHVRDGDVLVAIASPGLRCNGYSLARHVLMEKAGLPLDGPAWPGADRSLGEELLLPSVVYARTVLRLLEAVSVHGLAHVTGGGLPGNLPRVLPAGLGARVDAGLWERPRLFDEIHTVGEVSWTEMARTFNLGVGMVAVVAPGDAPRAVETIEGAGHASWVIGSVGPGSGVEMEGLR